MAKQLFVFNLTQSQVEQALREYAAGMIERSSYDVEIVGTMQAVTIRATKRRASRKAKSPKVAAGAKLASATDVAAIVDRLPKTPA